MGIVDGKVILITGAGQGMGRGYALTLAAEGARLVVNDIGSTVGGEGGDARLADEAVAMLRARGADAIADHSDISTWEGSERAVRAGIEHFGRLDGVVNNAGVLRLGDIADTTEQDFDLQVAVHLKGTYGCMRHACAYWREEHRAGRDPDAAIVNTTSEVAIQGVPHSGVYATAKAGIVSLTQLASLEGAEYGVRVNAVAPYGMTRMWTEGLTAYEATPAPHPEDQDDSSPTNPLNTAPLVAWLLSDEAREVTGQAFKFVGGSFARVRPWEWDAFQRPPGDQVRWRTDQLGDVIAVNVSPTRFPEPVRELPDGTVVPREPLRH